MDKKIGIVIGVVAVIVVIGIVVYPLLPDAGQTGGGMTFNGADYTWNELNETFESKTVDGNTGISLSAILNATEFANLTEKEKNETLFSVVASDGWTKYVSWSDLRQGILLEANTTAYFPHLPNAYKVKNLDIIDDVPLGQLAIIMAGEPWSASAELTWDEVFDGLATENFTHNADNYTGVNMTAVLEYADFSDLTNYTYTIEGVDGYSMTVTWADVQNGYLVLDQYKSVFPHLDNSFKVRNIIRIYMEEI